ncbi:MAG: TlyA family rRNA (cytidine-2'-O)-methyltransferase, partial [Spirochaetes bacterium]|nr:TlyA family rRNA (cytidine-2'-O)-methyltransferase [Spirochaetota bacterium]
MKERLDKLIVEQKIIETREKAKAYIIGGHITVNGETIIKPGSSVSRSAK